MDIKSLKGVGPKLSENLKSLGILSVRDAIYYFPRAYEDRNNLKAVSNMVDGEYVSFEGIVELIFPARKTFGRKSVNRVLFRNDTGNVVGVWFNQPYIRNNFSVGEKLFLYGKVSKKSGETQIIEPQYEKNIDDRTFSINPVYPLSKAVTQKILRKIIKQSLEVTDTEVPEVMPESFLKIYKLCGIKTALENIHFPYSNDMLQISHRRIKFEELLILQLCLYKAKMDFVKSRVSEPININDSIGKIKGMLSFELTNAQTRTIREMLGDMKKNTPMNRLIQGDVGSGKTIVAVIGLINCAVNGFQAAMMAPTEILAEQHYKTIKGFTDKFGLKIALVKGSIPAKEKKSILQKILSGDVDIVIGTHALIQEGVEFRNLALVVTDEQHRFGVRQRAELINKGNNPHVLVMTATPIPRTLALFIYSDMDISIIDELPPGRKKIDTYFIDQSQKSRIYNFIKKEIEMGRQAYVVCPLIDESEKMDMESAIQTREELKAEYFSDNNVGLLHGKMSAREKDEVMNSFVRGEIDVLVSTTVIEVGVNVPNATVMVIENADRFGLAQLHQLRGRVGRGEHKSYCVLISGVKSRESMERMKIMTKTNDGFVIAEKDMQLRGTGEFFGIRQHGLPELKMANIIQDIELVKETRDIARELIETGKINSPEYSKLQSEVEKFFAEKIDNVTFN